MLFINIIPLILGIIAAIVLIVILIYIGFTKLKKMSSFKPTTSVSRIRLRLNIEPRNDKEVQLAILTAEEQ